MFQNLKLEFVFFILLTVHCIKAIYTPPPGLVEPYKPAGFRISIPSKLYFHYFYIKIFIDLRTRHMK